LGTPRSLAATKPESINECTSFAVAGEHNNYWLAQNWDWCGLQREALCAIENRSDQGTAYITVTEAGMLAKIGINAHGLAITLNILRSDKDGSTSGVPVHFLLRALLDCENVEHAIELVSGLKFSSSSNIMALDASGTIISFCHTNHFLNSKLACFDVGKPGNVSTRNRLNRAESKVHKHMSRDDIIALLCDQSDGLESICRFPDPALPDIAQIETVTSVIMNTAEKTLCVSGAQPSVSTFKTYTL